MPYRLIVLLALAAFSFAHNLPPSVTCSAGNYIDFNLKCQPCPPGSYNPASVTANHFTICLACPAGTFNPNSGAKECCKCCAGHYSWTGATSCTKCSGSFIYSKPGCGDSSGCHRSPLQGEGMVPSCQMNGNQCPNPGGGGSHVPRKRSNPRCARGHKRCPLYSGVGGSECVDIANEPESCGGCISLDDEPPADAGVDCTALPGVSVTSCVRGTCVIELCRKGYTKTKDGKACISLSEQPTTNFTLQQQRTAPRTHSTL